MLLVEHHNKWYRCTRAKLSISAMSMMDSVVEVHPEYYYVIKDRRGGKTALNPTILDWLKVKLWSEGKTFDDLPLFIDNGLSSKAIGGLGLTPEGDLTMVEVDSYYDTRN